VAHRPRGACAAGAVAITQGAQEDTRTAAAPAQTTQTESSTDQRQEQKKKKKKKKKDEEKAADPDERAEQEVKVTVDAYVEAIEQGDTDALCAIQTEALAAQACSQARKAPIGRSCGRSGRARSISNTCRSTSTAVRQALRGRPHQLLLGQAEVGGVEDRRLPATERRRQERAERRRRPAERRKLPTGGNVAGGGTVELPAPQRPQLPQR